MNATEVKNDVKFSGEYMTQQIQNKLKHGNVIGKQALETVRLIILNLQTDLTSVRVATDKSAAVATKSAADSVIAADAATLKSEKAAQDASSAQKDLRNEIRNLETGRKITHEQLESVTQSSFDAVAAADAAVAAAKHTADVAAAECQQTILRLSKDFDLKNNEYKRMFDEALQQLDTALIELPKDLVVGNMAGGFQSSSSGKYDYKKYRSSSRSYSKQIKELKKKRKESKKKRRDAGKKTKHNETKKRNRKH